MKKIKIKGKKIRVYLVSISLVLMVTVFGEFVKRDLEPANIVMFYLLVIVISAVRWGKGPALTTSILGVLCFDFFLVPPFLTLSIASIHYIFTFFVFLVVGLIVSTLASRMREQTIQARKQEARASALYHLSDDLAGSNTFEEALEIIQRNVGRIFQCTVAIYLPVGETLELNNRDPGFPLGEYEKETAVWVFHHARSSRGRTDSTRPGKMYFVPFKTPQEVIGVMGMSFPDERDAISSDEEDLLNALVNQAAIAIQRAKLAEETRHIEVMRQTEKLQAALLNSISHDLRTPMVSITGTLTTLLDNSTALDHATQKELLQTANEDADRLNRIVGNLLDMTKMETGVLRINKQPCELRDLIGASLEQLKDRTGNRIIRIDIPKDLPEISVDFSFMMKAFFNIIDNAVKYSPADTPIHIKAAAGRNKIDIEVKDQGFGIAPNDLKRIFDKFYRAEKPQNISGTGLGLSICKGIVEAHNGRITVRNNPDKGVTFMITLPLDDKRD
ncbi:MAG: DUF4118 domain-containing protein [bacterium]|nr:DUF4118 domain-containing protein [bacterium]